MRKTAVVYWSGTGNTQMMAEKVAEGVRAAGAEADVYNCTEFSADLMDNYEAVAFGCPSMGSEQLEDTEFEPVFTECEAKLSGKVIGLFGSYGWGDGEWMRNWEETCLGDRRGLCRRQRHLQRSTGRRSRRSVHCAWQEARRRIIYRV